MIPVQAPDPKAKGNLAYAGMAMVSQLGGFEAQPSAHQGYLALLYSPIVLMITPRLYHKRLIKNPNVQLERERRASVITRHLNRSSNCTARS